MSAGFQEVFLCLALIFFTFNFLLTESAVLRERLAFCVKCLTFGAITGSQESFPNPRGEGVFLIRHPFWMPLNQQ